MKLTFQLNYRAAWGETLCVIAPSIGRTESNPLCLTCQGGDFWETTVEAPADLEELTYRYAVRQKNGSFVYEAGKERCVAVSLEKDCMLRDFWQSSNLDVPFSSIAFRGALFRRQKPARRKTPKGNIRFAAYIPQVLPTQGVAIIGSVPELGNWDPDRKLVLSDNAFPVWKADIDVFSTTDVEYKYVIYDLESDELVDTEYGDNRHVWGVSSKYVILQNDNAFRHNRSKWRGAGVAVPVFSLRSEKDFGIGEFLDLKLLADWAVATGQKMIQTLPINDTTLTHTNRDSYPYNAVSVFALHPIYINIERMGKLSPEDKKAYRAKQKQLNNLSFADYQNVYNEKTMWFKRFFEADRKALFKTKEYKAFFRKNEEWLMPYAEFMSRRDGEPKEYYFFLQYHADLQLSEAVAYAHSIGVAMKGDIPIGISPDSVDAYTNPELFNLDASAGAPPDDFSISGQNWGFPTYNWEEMAKDNFGWWQRRFRKMQDYFDAYRIDHILGFFRIWQMPKNAVWGLCGHFEPAMPYSMQDLWYMGVHCDRDRLTKPYIRAHFLGDVFGYDTEIAKRDFLNTSDGNIFWFKDEYDTQLKIQDWFDALSPEEQEKKRNIKEGLMYLHCEVLFVEDRRNHDMLHPRIALYQSHSYTDLPDELKKVVYSIHDEYFYRRHNEFWYQSAMRKLPTLIGATDMLVCGEDLGMVPECVPAVMHQLQILSLEIQRMPKDPKVTFAHPADAPYLSVCTTGTHDTNPLRAWWREDRAVTQRFYSEQMGWWGDAPQDMTPEIAEFIVNQHMYSPAMWVILPLQDWLAVDSKVRIADPEAERINVPANPRHFWKYRMHLTLEKLLKEDLFNRHIRSLTSRRTR